MTDYQLGDVQDWAALVFVRVWSELPDEHEPNTLPIGYVSIIEPQYGKDAIWKLPGGHCQNGEQPEETAARELAGETNIAVSVAGVQYAGQWLGKRGDHWKILFAADIAERELGWMGSSHPENEGEKPKFFTIEEFYRTVCAGEFMSEHYQKLAEFGLILPFGRDQPVAAAE